MKVAMLMGYMIVILQVREGKGKYTYSNGDIYNGEFKNNKKHGIGKLNYADKS